MRETGMDAIDRLDISDQDKAVLRAIGVLRETMRKGYGSPRAENLKLALADMTSELTGDREFFHSRNHGIGKSG